MFGLCFIIVGEVVLFLWIIYVEEGWICVDYFVCVCGSVVGIKVDDV